MTRLLVMFCLLFSAYTVRSQSYQPGHFTTLEGKCIRASIRFSSNLYGQSTTNGSHPGKIKIKAENDSKVYELTADEIRGFVMGLDSFVVIKNIPISEKATLPRDFAKVDAIGKLSLFTHCRREPNGRYGSKIRMVHILLLRGTNRLVAFHSHYQKSQFLELIQDDPVLVQSLNDDGNWMKSIPLVIRRYNTHFVDINAKK